MIRVKANEWVLSEIAENEIGAILGLVDGIISSYKEETVNFLSELNQKYIT